MIARLGRLPARARASASSTTPSTSSTATATTRGYALECLRAAADAGAENVTLCDTNGSSLPAPGRRGDAARSSRPSSDVDVGIHTHNDAECGVANSLAAVEAGRGAGPGHDERHRRAHRQRQPDLDPARAAAEARLRVRDATSSSPA